MKTLITPTIETFLSKDWNYLATVFTFFNPDTQKEESSATYIHPMTGAEVNEDEVGKEEFEDMMQDVYDYCLQNDYNLIRY